jgi:hypothetical protein
MTKTKATSTLDDPMTGSATAEPTHPLAEAGKEATQNVGQLAGRAADLGIQQADRGRTQAAEGIDQVAQTIRRVSTDMQTEQPTIANAAMTAADQAERVAQYLRQTDARQIISGVEDVARRQPILFIGGAFLVGIAASRFIKAAGGGQGTQGTQAYQSGYSTDYQSDRTADFRTSDTYEPTGPGTINGNEGF